MATPTRRTAVAVARRALLNADEASRATACVPLHGPARRATAGGTHPSSSGAWHSHRAATTRQLCSTATSFESRSAAHAASHSVVAEDQTSPPSTASSSSEPAPRPRRGRPRKSEQKTPAKKTTTPKRTRKKKEEEEEEEEKEQKKTDDSKASTSASARSSKPKPPRISTVRPTNRTVFQQTFASDFDIQLFEHPHLPHPEQWEKVFPTLRAFSGSRYVVANKETIRRMLATLRLDELAAKGIKTTVIEGYPGPGMITRQLLEHPAVEKVIAMEDNKKHLDYLDILKADPELGHKLVIIRKSAYFWESYNDILEHGHLDHLGSLVRTKTGEPAVFRNEVYKHPVPTDDPSWQDESPILFLAQLPSSVYGDQLYAQLIFAIAMRRWLFRFSRIRLAFTINRGLLSRLHLPASHVQVTRTATVTHNLADLVRTPFDAADALEPYATHFYPSRQPVGARLMASSRSLGRANTPSTASKLGIGWLVLEPKKKIDITPDTFEEYEYLTRMLFVLRTKTVSVAMKTIGPGAENVIKMLNKRGAPEERIDPEQTVVSLTTAQWAGLSRMFKLWPFKPQILVEGTPERSRDANNNI